MKKIAILFTLISLISSMTTAFDRNSNLSFKNKDINAVQRISKKYNSNTMQRKKEHLDCIEIYDFTNTVEIDFYQTTSFDMKTYFRNLYTYSSENTGRSCTYVALIQAMSYYDTFYNDDVILEQYDFADENNASMTVANLHSPGVYNEDYDPDLYQSFTEFICQTKGYNLQSKLTYLYNQIIGNVDSNGNILHVFEETNDYDNYSRLLHTFYGINSYISVVRFYDRTQEEYEQIIKNSIDSNNPVIVGIDNKPSSSYLGHAVLAYDYDQQYIYANYGWGYGYTRKRLIEPNETFKNIHDLAILDYSGIHHKHSDNYVINGEGICGCNLSDEIHIEEEIEYDNIPPTIYWMKDQYNEEETYTLQIQISNEHPYLFELTMSRNQITFPVDLWQEMINATQSSILYLHFQRNSSRDTYQDIWYTFDKPTVSLRHVDIDFEDFNMDMTHISTENSLTQLYNDLTIGCEHKGCLYFNNEVNMSTSLSSSNKSYFKFNLSKDVYRIDINISLFSRNEFIGSPNLECKLYYYETDGRKVELADLLNSPRINTDDTIYRFVFPHGIRCFSIESNKTNDLRALGQGRIKLSDLDIYVKE